MPDRVRLHPENLTDYAVFWSGEVSAYVVRADTFVTVPAFVQRKGHRAVPASFAQRLYRDDRYEVLSYQDPTFPKIQRQYVRPAAFNGPGVTMAGAAIPQPVQHRYTFFDFVMETFVYPRDYQKMLLRHAGQTLELPAKAGAYRTFMLSLLADDPALCTHPTCAPASWIRALRPRSCWPPTPPTATKRSYRPGSEPGCVLLAYFVSCPTPSPHPSIPSTSPPSRCASSLSSKPSMPKP